MQLGQIVDMNSSPSNGDYRHARQQAAHARDAALTRISRTRRLLIGAVAGLTALFAAIASALAPGRTASASAQQRTATGSAQTSSTGVRPASARKLPPLAGASALGLQGPTAAPQAAPQPAPQAAPSADQSAPAPSSAAPAPAQQPSAVSGGS